MSEGGRDGRALLLYVDVEESNHALAVERLRSAYRVLPASGDRRACELLRSYGDELVAVLFDVDLPGSVLDGILLTRILRGRMPLNALPPFARGLPTLAAPILLVTERSDAHSEALSETDVRRYGGDGLLPKPLGIGRLTLALTDWHLRQ